MTDKNETSIVTAVSVICFITTPMIIVAVLFGVSRYYDHSVCFKFSTSIAEYKECMR